MRDLASYEHHLHNVVARCCTRWIVLTRSDKLAPEWIVAPATCKSNYCTLCRANNLRQTRRRLLTALRRHTWRLVTLTYPQDHIPATDRLNTVNSDVRKFCRSLVAAYPRASYARTLELHQSQYPHIHLVIDRYVPRDWIASTWSALGGGNIDIRARQLCPTCHQHPPCTHIPKPRKLSFRTAAAYLTEELRKPEQDPYTLGYQLWQHRMRTFSTSRNLQLSSTSSPYRFDGIHNSLEDAMYHYELAQFRADYMDGSPPRIIDNGHSLTITTL